MDKFRDILQSITDESSASINRATVVVSNFETSVNYEATRSSMPSGYHLHNRRVPETSQVTSLIKTKVCPIPREESKSYRRQTTRSLMIQTEEEGCLCHAPYVMYAPLSHVTRI